MTDEKTRTVLLLLTEAVYDLAEVQARIDWSSTTQNAKRRVGAIGHKIAELLGVAAPMHTPAALGPSPAERQRLHMEAERARREQALRKAGLER